MDNISFREAVQMHAQRWAILDLTSIAGGP